MLLSDHPRTVYGRAPAHEVICQFRFPVILSINNTEPADFQEAVRAAFPKYAKMQDTTPPQVTGLDGPNPQILRQPPVNNYNFLSADSLWKLNLTQNFIALSPCTTTAGSRSPASWISLWPNLSAFTIPLILSGWACVM